MPELIGEGTQRTEITGKCYGEIEYFLLSSLGHEYSTLSYLSNTHL